MLSSPPCPRADELRLKVLFITHTRIGDAVLSSGILHHLVERYPDAHFTIVCGPLAASLFASTPRLERIIPFEKRPFDAHWFALWRQLRGTTWDIIVDLRRSLISYIVPVRNRYVVGPIAAGVHHVRHLSELLRLSDVASPFLATDARHQIAGATLIPDGAPVLAIAPVAATKPKTWAPERFAALVAALTADDGVCAGWRVALFGGPGDDVAAAPLLAALPHALKIFGEADLLTVHAALARCRAFIGNDSGLVHLAASTGIPALSIFGPMDPARYGPWGGRAVVAPDRDIANLEVVTVIEAFRELLARS